MLDIPSQHDFNEKDVNRIKDWLLNSVRHPGFHAYLKARDRSFAQTMIGLDIENPAQRRMFYELQGRRLETARLIQRAEKVARDADEERRKKSREAVRQQKRSASS